MIEKAFNDKESVKKFKKKYASGEIETEVIMNLFYNGATEYIKSWDNFLDGLAYKVVLIVSAYAEKALLEKFGKHDFKFDGNRTYTNWVLKFKDNLFICPAKREIVWNEGSRKEQKDVAIEFEKEFINLCLDYVYRHKDELDQSLLNLISKLEESNVIKNGKLTFDCESNRVKNKI